MYFLTVESSLWSHWEAFLLEMCQRQGSVDVAKPPSAAPYLRSHYHILISPLQLKAVHVPRALNWILFFFFKSSPFFSV